MHWPQTARAPTYFTYNTVRKTALGRQIVPSYRGVASHYGTPTSGSSYLSVLHLPADPPLRDDTDAAARPGQSAGVIIFCITRRPLVRCGGTITIAQYALQKLSYSLLPELPFSRSRPIFGFFGFPPSLP